jgi:hypothetical protein
MGSLFVGESGWKVKRSAVVGRDGAGLGHSLFKARKWSQLTRRS